MADEPVRMRVYGLFRLTRGGYLALQAVILLLLGGGMLGWLLAGMPTREPFRDVWLLANLHWVLAALLIFESLETYFMLSAYHRKERIVQRLKRK